MGGAFGGINQPTAGPRFEQDLPRGAHPYQLYSLGTPNGNKAGHREGRAPATRCRFRRANTSGAIGGADDDDKPEPPTVRPAVPAGAHSDHRPIAVLHFCLPSFEMSAQSISVSPR